MKINSHRLLTLTPCAQSALCFVAICASLPLHAQAQANAVAAGTLGEIRVQGAAGSGTLRATSQSAAGFGDKPLLDTPFQVNVFTEKLFADQQARSICDPSRPPQTRTILIAGV